MKVLPTLNIQNGRVLRIDGTLGSSPIEVACTLARAGCNRIAFTDVDAARSTGQNRAAIVQAMHAFRQIQPKCCIQVGGGIRASDQAQFYLDHGATWLLVGTVLHALPVVAEQLVARFQDRLIANIDARQGQVQASGWACPADQRPEVLATHLRACGFRRLLFTDIPSEATTEPDFDTATRILTEARLPMFMGGSLRTQAHVERAARLPGLQGICLEAHLVLDCPNLLAATAQPTCA